MLKRLYALFAILVIGGYAFAAVRGMELPRARKTFAPQSVRGANPGARTYWYGGYRGGK
jgi:hypothetical protein